MYNAYFLKSDFQFLYAAFLNGNGTFDDMVEHARSTYLFCPNLCTQPYNSVITRKIYIDTSKTYRYNSG